MRAPFQVLVLPYCCSNEGRTEYAIFKRSDAAYWQFIAGGGEDKETPIEAAKREANEEAGIPFHSEYIMLDSKNTVPVEGVTGKFTWGENIFVIPEYTFGVRLDNRGIVLHNVRGTLTGEVGERGEQEIGPRDHRSRLEQPPP